MILIPWAKTATPSDGKRARRSLRASPLSAAPSLYLGGPTTATIFVPATQSQATMAQGKCDTEGCGQFRIAQIAHASLAGSTAEI